MASGATSVKLVSRGPDGPAASATAWAPNACRWMRRKPETPHRPHPRRIGYCRVPGRHRCAQLERWRCQARRPAPPASLSV